MKSIKYHRFLFLKPLDYQARNNQRCAERRVMRQLILQDCRTVKSKHRRACEVHKYKYTYIYSPPVPPHVLLWNSWSSLLGMAGV